MIESEFPAFVLGAGLGKRLRPLTESLPKPLIPLWNKPLITYALDHLVADLGTKKFIVNTHHAPEAWPAAFPDGTYLDASIEFRHEPTLLETAGGIDNIRDWIPREDSFVVYNGDVLSDLPLKGAAEAHLASDDLVTLVLRSRGHALQVARDPGSGRVTDIGDRLGTGAGERFQFTGIYFLRPEFVDRFIVPGKIESVIHPFLSCIRENAGVGSVVVDDGHWSDLGNREAYLEASSATLNEENFPRYRNGDAPLDIRIHPQATIEPFAQIDEGTSVGPGAFIEAGAKLRRSIIWGNATVRSGVVLRDCIVQEGHDAGESLMGLDV